MLPKAIPDYRVLTYDYPAPVVAAFGLILTSENILGIATTMVTELAADCYVRTNPLASSEFFFFFFLCHSLGGIIVKQVQKLLRPPDDLFLPC